MVSIEQIKKHGQIKELSSEINSKIFQITNRTFEGYIKNNRYSCLGDKTRRVRELCDDIDKLLKAVNQLQPGHK